MKQSVIARKSKITHQYLSLILKGQRTPSWKTANRIGIATGSDPRIWADCDLGSIGYLMDRLYRLSAIAKAAGIKEPRILDVLAGESVLTTDEIYALALASGSHRATWKQVTLNATMDIIEKERHENYPVKRTPANRLSMAE